MGLEINAERSGFPRWMTVMTGLLLILVVALLFTRSMGAPLDHDEHQFVASGALLARHAQLPYRDFPYFHTPNLAFVYAGVFRETRYLLLGARLVSTACGVATVAITFAVAYAALRTLPVGLRWSGAVTAAMLLLVNPLFLSADGLAWNHDAAEMLLLASAGLFLREMSRGHRPIPLAACGALLGLAVGTRLTIAPAAAAFVGFILADPRRRSVARVASSIAFLVGAVLALAPSLWMLCLSPRGFTFGNFQYAGLNTAWRQGGLHGRDTTPAGKLLEFAAILLKPGDLLLLVMAVVGALAIRNRRQRLSHPNRMQLTFLGLLVLFLLVGSFAPSPSFAVYFYAPVPLVIWWVAYAVAPSMMPHERTAKVLIAATAATCLVLGVGAYRGLGLIARPSRWVPYEVHATGEELRAATGPGRVLTLAPIFPLEGGQDIYEAYATGPFASRVADLVDRPARGRVHLMGSSDLPAALRRQPPTAVVLGFEGELEWPLKHNGTVLGCQVVRLRKTPDPGRWLITPEGLPFATDDSVRIGR